MSEVVDDRLPLLRVYPNFLSGDELDFWSGMVRRDEFWVQTGAFRHEEDSAVGYQPPHFVMNEEFLRGVEGFYKREEFLVSSICDVVEDFFAEDFVVGSQLFFRKWVKGYFQHTHFDHANSDGVVDIRSHGDEPESAMPIAFHDVATVLYYNDDFDGGEITFLDGDVSIKPTPGMLAVFPCTEFYGHGVNEILAGERYMSAHFWTRAKTIVMDTHGGILGESWSRKVRWREKVDRHLVNDAS
jgi:hypothetical protein